MDEVFKRVAIHNEMEATEQYFPVLTIITLYKLVLTFESEYEIFTHELELLSSTFLRCYLLC